MSIQEIAQDFLQLVSSGKVHEGFSNYVAANFIHHNPYFKGTREALQTAMIEAHETSPNEFLEVKKSYVDKDTVITHALVKKQDMEIAVVHIFRFEDSKIVELWDLGQVIDVQSPNENGLF